MIIQSLILESNLARDSSRFQLKLINTDEARCVWDQMKRSAQGESRFAARCWASGILDKSDQQPNIDPSNILTLFEFRHACIAKHVFLYVIKFGISVRSF